MEMQKPYDAQALVEALKKEGIEGGIETGKKVVAVLADFLRSSAEKSKEGLVGKLDDFAIPGINYFEKLAIEKLSEAEASFHAAGEQPAQPVDGQAPAQPADGQAPAAPAVNSPEVPVATPAQPVSGPPSA